MCCCRYSGWKKTIYHHKYIPESYAPPDEEVLNPGEVMDRECYLAIYGPNYTSIHRRPEDLIVNNLTISPEGLIDHGIDGEEEDNYGSKNSITYPKKDVGPAEEDVFDSLSI